MRPLLCMPWPTIIPEVKAELDKIPEDKVFAIGFKQQEAYDKLRHYFLTADAPSYDYMCILPYDVICKQEDFWHLKRAIQMRYSAFQVLTGL